MSVSVTKENREHVKTYFFAVLRQRYPINESYDFLSPLIAEKEEKMYFLHRNNQNAYSETMAQILWQHSFWSELVRQSKDDKYIARIVIQWWMDRFKEFDGTSKEQLDNLMAFMFTFTFFCAYYFNSDLCTYLTSLQRELEWNYVYGRCLIDVAGKKNGIAYIKQSADGKYIPSLNFMADYTHDTMDWYNHYSYLNVLYKMKKQQCPIVWKQIAKLHYHGLYFQQSYDRGEAYCSEDPCIGQGRVDQLLVALRIIVDANYYGNAPYYVVLKLRLVCKSWDRVILNCGRFWSSLEILPDELKNNTSLENLSIAILEHVTDREIEQIEYEVKVREEDIKEHKNKINVYEGYKRRRLGQ